MQHLLVVMSFIMSRTVYFVVVKIVITGSWYLGVVTPSSGLVALLAIAELSASVLVRPEGRSPMRCTAD